MSRILLTGATGQVGSELLRTLQGLDEVSVPVEIIAPGREKMDLADAASVRRAVREIAPRWVINPAAYTAVDKAESEPELAYAINRDAIAAMADEARKIGAAVIHFSTDYVFDGAKAGAYVEEDAASPGSVYGASKLAGEQALAASGAAHMIFRTSWVFGATGKNFLRTIHKAAHERELLRVVADQHGAPTWSRDLARMTAHCIGLVEGGAAERRLRLDDAMRELTGVYHAAGAGETTWFGFAEEIVRLARARESGAKLARVEAITTAEYPTPARRPANSRMDCTKLADRLGWKMMEWHESVAEVMQEL